MNDDDYAKYQEDAKAYIQGIIRREAQKHLQEMAKMATAAQQQDQINKTIDETMKANPEYDQITIAIAKAIVDTHPKITNAVEAYELLVPYLLGVAHDIEKEIEKRLPENWRNHG